MKSLKKISVPLIGSYHPEQKEGEKCIGICSDKIWDKIAWKTKRKGKINKHGTYPIFIKIQEQIDYFNNKFEIEDTKVKLTKKKLKK